MILLKRMGIFSAVLVLGACSYFQTEEIEVTSEEIIVEEPKPQHDSVESIIYHKTDGAVQIYDLDVSESEAEGNFGPLDQPDPAPSVTGAVNASPGVEIYPIDVPMRKTLKPVQ